ncbi:hypothetical protein [Fusicatenibacter sp.]
MWFTFLHSAEQNFCLGCGACTGHCPQSIDTPAIMEELGKLLK